MLFGNKTVNELVKEAYETAVSKGWHEEKREFGTLLALIHSEVTEAYEADNVGHLVEEMSDVIIRIFSLCGEYNYNLEYFLDKVHSDRRIDGSKLTTEKYFMNLHSKISHVLELYRDSKLDNKDEKLTESLAEVVSYVLTITYPLKDKYDIKDAVLTKMFKNKNRSYRHGGKII